ncbi:hypothetical protein MW887_011510 [Aspergillus wentii]|nr:hypothetical protein MW887_011510 [Aspergillus wentii]
MITNYNLGRTNTHPDWDVTCLVRSKAKGEKVSAAHPSASLVYGEQDSIDLLEDEASKADIVIHAAASDEHAPSAKAIVRGLQRRQRGYYINTSGGLSLATESISTGRYGDRFDKVYDDWENGQELLSHPEHTPHRHVDRIVLAAASNSLKTAIIAPAVIYGKGRWPDKKKSFPLFTSFLKHRKVFAVGKGENIWHYIHVQDLGNIYLRLAEAAVNNIPVGWNEEGYYLAENGYYVVREILQLAAKIMYDKGLLDSEDVEHLSADEADKLMPYARIVLGVCSRGVAVRARKLLDWKPCMPSFEDEMGESIDIEAVDIG